MNFCGQALVNFIIEFTEAQDIKMEIEPTDPPTLNLFVDSSSGVKGSGTGVVLVSPKGHKLNCAMRFSFKASNNVVEYEALSVGLRLSKKCKKIGD